MPFELRFLPSYERCVKKLGFHERRIAGLVVEALYEYFQSETMASDKAFTVQLNGRSHRLVFKKLRGSIWEAYLEGKTRVLTRIEKNAHILVFAGNHDQVRQFLKEN